MVNYFSEPETVTNIIEKKSTTSSLELTVTPPLGSVFVSYSLSVDDGYLYFRNYTYPANETMLTIGNLSAGIEYNVSVGTMSEWEESGDQLSKLFSTGIKHGITLPLIFIGQGVALACM